LQEGQILPNTLLPDIPIQINGFAPRNFNMQYEGAVPASGVTARSLNVPSVYLLREYGVPKFYDFLKKAGITTLTQSPSHYGLSLILGGAEATLWDISFAYSGMARSLLNRAPAGGSVVPAGNPAALPGVFSPGAVWQVFDAIKEVNRPEETDWRFIPSMQKIAWKTGTSYGFRDAWATGVTSRYVVGVWVGNANGEGKPELVGARTAGPVMFDIFDMLPQAPWFACPASEFVEAPVCRRSGHLKGRFCDEVDTLLILPNGLRTEACPHHMHIHLSADGRYRVRENCLQDGQQAVPENRFVLPPAWEWYYKQHHPEYTTLPPFMKGCGEDPHSPMAFIYPPEKNVHVYLPKQPDGSDGEITVELVHSNADATVYWHIDSDYLASTRDFHKCTFRLSRGKHSVTAVDNEGNSLSTGITVE
jgi:penicillin-binding protein 1C